MITTLKSLRQKHLNIILAYMFSLHNIPHAKKQQHIEDQNERLPALISEPYEDEEDLVFDPARHKIEFLTYFYKDSQDPSIKEVCKCKHMNQL